MKNEKKNEYNPNHMKSAWNMYTAMPKNYLCTWHNTPIWYSGMEPDWNEIIHWEYGCEPAPY